MCPRVIDGADVTDHLRRIREHIALETKALLLEAERARLFDHNGNRGSEAEQSILRWIRARFAPDYTVSSGEVIDSFDTNADIKSRQQDGILHRNDPEANRFLLPSGMRLVPIERSSDALPEAGECVFRLTQQRQSGPGRRSLPP